MLPYDFKRPERVGKEQMRALQSLHEGFGRNFGAELSACAEVAMRTSEGREKDALLARIDRAIEPFDVAGLLDRRRRDWYPVLADDLLSNASKLDASTGDVERLLERCGFVSRATGSHM